MGSKLLPPPDLGSFGAHTFEGVPPGSRLCRRQRPVRHKASKHRTRAERTAAERDEYGEFGGGRTLKDTASSLECNCMWREAQRVACNAATLAKSGEEPAHRATREAKT